MKVQPFKIPKHIDSTLVVQVDKSQVFYNQLHQHAEIQISYIVNGHGKLIVADSIYSYDSDNIFIIGSNTPHLFQSEGDTTVSHMISLFFTKEGFGPNFFDIPELSEIKKFLQTSTGGFQVLSKKKSIKNIMFKLPETDKLDTFLSFLKLIRKINIADKQTLTRYTTKKISNAEGRRLQVVFDYVMNHFDADITLNQVSGLVHMTSPAFCRFFKQHTNKTFFEFLIKLRIAHACQLLASPKKISIAEISEASGFSSISHFNRKFKKIKKETPSQYMRKMGAISSF